MPLWYVGGSGPGNLSLLGECFSQSLSVQDISLLQFKVIADSCGGPLLLSLCKQYRQHCIGDLGGGKLCCIDKNSAYRYDEKGNHFCPHDSARECGLLRDFLYYYYSMKI